MHGRVVAYDLCRFSPRELSGGVLLSATDPDMRLEIDWLGMIELELR